MGVGTIGVVYLLILVFLLSGNVTLSIMIALIYNNYLWWEKGFQYNDVHLLINAGIILVLFSYISLHGRISRNEDRKLRELDIKEIY